MIEFLVKNKTKVTWITLWTGLEIEKAGKTKFYKKNGFTKLAYQPDYYKDGIGATLFVRRIKK